MDNLEFINIIWLFPIVFMLHDFEEIILIELWARKNKVVLLKNHPRVATLYTEVSTASFALAVSEEFIVLSLITLGSVIFSWYYLWLGALVGFFIHLVVHLIQWIVFKKYIPAIATTIPSIIYSVYAINYICVNSSMEISPLIIWSVLGVIIVFINLIFARKLSGRFNKYIKDNCNH